MLFLILCVLATVVVVRKAQKETRLKKKFGGAGICKSDLDLS